MKEAFIAEEVIQINIYDIAAEAGVSISTVSRVLNKKENVTVSTRKKIEDIMQKYNYKPNAVAQGLVIKSMKTIGILSVDIRVPHYANTSYVVEQEFSRAGYNVILCNTGGSMDENRKYIQSLVEKQIDGILFVGSTFNPIQQHPDIVEILKETPIVIANGQMSLPLAYSILVDDAMGVNLAVSHLYEKGHKDIVYIKDLNTESAAIKMTGYQAAMASKGLEDRASIINTTYGIEGGKAAVKMLTESNKAFSAIVCGEDLTAVGVVKQLAAFGYKVPKDIAVTGYNNSVYSQISSPEITTIDNKGDTVGRLSAQLLRNLVEQTGQCASIVVQPELILGGSS